jgi:predicted amidohydrolase
MGGGSQVIGPTGDLLAAAPPDEQRVLETVIDLAALRQYRRSFPVLRDRQNWL